MSGTQAGSNPGAGGGGALSGELHKILKSAGKKGSIFQQNQLKTGIDLSQLSGSMTAFGSDLRESIEKQHNRPPSQPTLLPTLTQESKPMTIPVDNTKLSGPMDGFFGLDSSILGESTHTGHETNYCKESTRHRSLSPGPGSKPQLQRKGSLSPGPISSCQPTKWTAKDRYQPYSASGRRKRTLSLPGDDDSKFTSKDHGCTQGQLEVKKLDFPYCSRLVSLIFSSHPRYSREFTNLGTTFRIQVDVLEGSDHLVVHLKGHPKGIAKAESKLNQLVTEIQEKIISEVVSPLVPCAFIPLLMSQEVLSLLEEIEENNRVNIVVCKTDGSQASLNAPEFTQHLSSPESIPKLIDFKDILTPIQPVPIEYKWQVEYAGEFQPVPREVEQFINRCYYSGLPQFSYNGKHYQLDIVDEWLCDADTGTVHKLLKQPVPPVWSYCLGSEMNFLDFPPQDSETLDNLLCYGGSGVKVLHIDKGTVDFENMALVNLGSLVPTDLINVRRNPPISAMPMYGFRLAIKGLKDDISFAKLNLKAKIEEISLVEEKVTVPIAPLEQQHMIRTQVVNNARQYFINLSTEMNEDKGHIVVVIKGEQRYVQSVHLQLQKDAVELQQHLLCQDRQRVHSHQYFSSAMLNKSSYPEEWNPQAKACELQGVAVNSVEWAGVLTELRKTMPHVRLLKLERIQNKPLWDKYALEMVHMGDRNGDEGINEKLLFHGTRRTDPKVIIESVKGIDFRYSSEDRSLLWGKGAYFAVNASYSDSYCHRSSCGKQMLLVRVLTGRSCSYGHGKDPSLTKPPPLSKGGHVLYDTVNGHTNGSDVYIVYDHDRAYPAYLITYN